MLLDKFIIKLDVFYLDADVGSRKTSGIARHN